MITRQPAVSGIFYPDKTETLQREVDELLAHAKTHEPAPRALIVPHAGYVYSGPVAATAYRNLQAVADRFDRVVLLGPSHRVAFRGVAAPGCDAFQTPLGSIPVDRELLERVLRHPQVSENTSAHALEHSLEVQLPFLQRVLGKFSLLPLVVGDIEPQAMSEILSLAWRDAKTLVVISTDLSHYLTYEQARDIDRETTHMIERLDPIITGERACGCRPLNGLLEFGRNHDLQITNIDLRNSGDTAGDKSRVVGYGAYVIH